MGPTRLPHAPYPLAYTSQTAAGALHASLPSAPPPHLDQDGRSATGPLSAYPHKIGLESTRASS
jgi:hypothetical protein